MTVSEALQAQLYTSNLDQTGWFFTCATRLHLKGLIVSCGVAHIVCMSGGMYAHTVGRSEQIKAGLPLHVETRCRGGRNGRFHFEAHLYSVIVPFHAFFEAT
jgi:hypothetical protein